MKNKVIAILGTAVLIGALLVGCNKNTVVTETNDVQEPSEVYSAVITDDSGREDSEPEESEPVSKGMMTGGWAACADNNSKLTDEEQTIFDDALSEMQGLDYQGLAVIATQVVSGTNRAYLACGGAKGEEKGYAIIVVYSDLQGNNIMNSEAIIDPTDLHIKDASGENLLGGWKGIGTGKAWMLPSETAQESFEKLFTTDDDTMRNPIALLDTQVVAGANYLAMSIDKQGNVYLSKWYRDLDGNAQILEDGVLDMDYYTQNH